MLKGYALLAQHCPRCNTPLISKKGGDMICCGCDATVVPESQSPSASKLTAPTSSSSSSTVSAAMQMAVDEFEGGNVNSFAEGAVPPQSYEEMRREYDANNKARDAVSSKLGTYMLQGWAMLGTLCPVDKCRGTPLMKKKGEEMMLCVSCDRKYKFAADKSLVITNRVTFDDEARDVDVGEPLIKIKVERPSSAPVEEPEARPVQTAATAIPDLRPHSQATKTKVKDPSAMLSEKLLQGWAMLKHTCQSTECHGQVPVMRDRKGTVQCVVCGAGALAPTTSTVAAQAAVSVSVPSKTATQNTPTMGNSDDCDIGDDMSDDADVFAEYGARRREEMRKGVSASTTATTEAVAAASARTGPTSMANAGRPTVSTGPLAARQVAISAIETRIVTAARELEASTDVQRSVALAELLVSLAGADQAMRGMSQA